MGEIALRGRSMHLWVGNLLFLGLSLICRYGWRLRGMSETDEISQRRATTVIAHRSPREGQQDFGHEGDCDTMWRNLSLCTPPETEISSINHS